MDLNKIVVVDLPMLIAQFRFMPRKLSGLDSAITIAGGLSHSHSCW